MTIQTQDHGSATYFFVGVLIGGLAGAAVSLMLAPRSGKETRDQIRQMGIELRDEATATADNAVAQVHQTSRRVSTEVHEKVGALKRRGQEIIDEQREHFSELLASENNKVKMPS